MSQCSQPCWLLLSSFLTGTKVKLPIYAIKAGTKTFQHLIIQYLSISAPHLPPKHHVTRIRIRYWNFNQELEITGVCYGYRLTFVSQWNTLSLQKLDFYCFINAYLEIHLCWTTFSLFLNISHKFIKSETKPDTIAHLLSLFKHLPFLEV